MTTVIVIAVVAAFAVVWLKMSHQDRRIASLHTHQKRLARRMEIFELRGTTKRVS